MSKDNDFVLLTTYRSGSTWLMDMLNHIEGITTFAELFHQPTEFEQPDAAQTEQYLKQTIRAYPHYYSIKSGRRPVWRYLAEFYAQPQTVGFKLMYPHLLTLPEIWPFVMKRRLNVIHLVRQNLLDVVISREMRRKTQVTHQLSGETIRPQQITLEPDWLMGKLNSLHRHVQLARGLLRASGVRHLEIHYETLKGDPSTFVEACHFLGYEMGDGRPESRLTKLVRTSYPDTLANYEEVVAALTNTPFESFLLEK